MKKTFGSLCVLAALAALLVGVPGYFLYSFTVSQLEYSETNAHMQFLSDAEERGIPKERVESFTVDRGGFPGLDRADWRYLVVFADEPDNVYRFDASHALLDVNGVHPRRALPRAAYAERFDPYAFST